MTQSEIRDEALARLPGWSDATCTPMPGGTNNTVYLLEAAGRQAVLKFPTATRGFPLNTREQEAAVQSAAAAIGLAPAVLCVEGEFMLEEFLPGRGWTAADFGRPEQLRNLAACLRRLHSLPPTGRPFPLATAARAYYDRLPDGVDQPLADQHLATVLSHPMASDLCCSHNDLVAANIRESDGIRLLDWEYASDNDPVFDLATIAEDQSLDERSSAILLAAYFGSNANDRSAAFHAMRRVYAALTWLWDAARA
jgi:thiamine kinase